MIERATGGSGADILVGNDANNLIWGRGGADAAVDGGGSDTLVGDTGNDEVRLSQDTSLDVVIGGDGQDKIDAFGGSGGDDSDALLAFGGDTGQLVAGPSQVADFAAVSSSLASAISTLTAALPTGYSAGSSDGADTIHGGQGSDTLSGGSGDDQLSGGNGRDVLFGDAGNDTLDGGDGNDDLYGATGTDSLNGGAGSDLLASGASGQTLVGGAGADKIVVLHADDVINPGADNDLIDLSQLPGEASGAVTITLGTDFGHDYVKTPAGSLVDYALDASSFSKSSLQLVLGAGRITDVTSETHEGGGSNNGLGSTTTNYLYDDVYVKLGDSTIRIGSGFGRHVEGNPVFGGPGDEFDGIQGDVTIHFSDGDVSLNSWIFDHQEQVTSGASSSYLAGSKDYYLARNLGTDSNDTFAGSSGDDFLVGNDGNDVLVGGGGNDHLEGGAGDDELSVGSGTDYIDGGAGDDTTTFTGAYADYTIAVADGVVTVTNTSTGDVATLVSVEHAAFSDRVVDITGGDTFVGTSGAEELDGTSFSDSFNGKAGDDLLVGGGGSDQYLYASGDGSDEINDSSQSIFDVDVLQLADLAPSDVTLSDDGGTLVVHVTATGATIRVDDQFYSDVGHVGVEEIHFSGGTVWNRSQIDSAAHGGSSITGTSGDDSLSGTSLDDVINGGTGDDTLAGGLRSDTYVYQSGDGDDLIRETDPSLSSLDVLRLSGMAPGDITLTASGDDVLVHITATGDTITLLNQVASSLENYGIEKIQFDGGVSWTRDQLLDHLPAGWNVIGGTSGNDSLTDTHRDDVLEGGLGNDTLVSDDGQDTFLYHSGDGSDQITDQSASLQEADILKLADLGSSDITLTKSGDDLLVHVTGTSDVIRIVDQFLSRNENYGIEAIKFEDGSLWNRSQIYDHLPPNWAEIPGTSGADSLAGTSDNDIFIGGAGNDTLDGGTGSDTYRYASGDGSDVIIDHGSFSFTDTLQLTNLTLSDVTLTKSGDDLLVHVTGTSDVIRIVDQFATFGGGLEQIQFASGDPLRSYDFDSYLNVTGGSGNDTVEGGQAPDFMEGNDGNDVLIGGWGNDTLTGGNGADVFQFNSVDDTPAGDYRDVIVDFASGADLIDLSRIDASSAAGDQAFTWIGTSAFSNVAGQLRYEVTSSGSRMVLGDTDGDGVADLQIEVQTPVTLTATDFVL